MIEGDIDTYNKLNPLMFKHAKTWGVRTPISMSQIFKCFSHSVHTIYIPYGVDMNKRDIIYIKE